MIKHTDGSVCQHKKTWAFYNHKPPQKDEVPGVSGKKSSKYSLCSDKADKNTAVIEINSCLDDTMESETLATTRKFNTTHKENETKHTVSTENVVTTNGTDLQSISVDTENNDETFDDIRTGVTTENPSVNSQDLSVNTENPKKTLGTDDDKAITTENPIVNTHDLPVNTESPDKTLDANGNKAVHTENHLITNSSVETEAQ